MNIFVFFKGSFYIFFKSLCLRVSALVCFTVVSTVLIAGPVSIRGGGVGGGHTGDWGPGQKPGLCSRHGGGASLASPAASQGLGQGQVAGRGREWVSRGQTCRGPGKGRGARPALHGKALTPADRLAPLLQVRVGGILPPNSSDPPAVLSTSTLYPRQSPSAMTPPGPILRCSTRKT